MAKRKRLAGADPVRLKQTPLETKAMFPLGVARHAAPIADVARDSAATAALEEMSDRWNAAREGGRIVLAVPHDAIDLEYLHRDRMMIDADEMTSLTQSLSERGQQTPVEVVALLGGGYGLLSGWRRCQGLRALYAQTGEARFATVLALLRSPEEASDAYRTMVDENEIRANLSHYERARVVIKAVDAGVFVDEEAGLAGLFGAVPRARRSKIRSFLVLVNALEGAVSFPDKISERAGLDIVQKIQADTEFGSRLRAALIEVASTDVAAEQAVIKSILASSSKPEKKALHKVMGSDMDAGEEVLGNLQGVRVSRLPNGALILSGAGVTDAFAQKLMAWLVE
jgi:ParB family chromosome partitioning protein